MLLASGSLAHITACAMTREQAGAGREAEGSTAAKRSGGEAKASGVEAERSKAMREKRMEWDGVGMCVMLCDACVGCETCVGYALIREIQS